MPGNIYGDSFPIDWRFSFVTQKLSLAYMLGAMIRECGGIHHCYPWSILKEPHIIRESKLFFRYHGYLPLTIILFAALSAAVNVVRLTATSVPTVGVTANLKNILCA